MSCDETQSLAAEKERKDRLIEEFLQDWRWIFNIVMEKHDEILPTEDIEKLHKLDKKWEQRLKE